MCKTLGFSPQKQRKDGGTESSFLELVDSFSQVWGVAQRNEEAVQELTWHTAQFAFRDLGVGWGSWGWGVMFADPSKSSGALVAYLNLLLPSTCLSSGVPNKPSHQISWLLF